MDQKLLYSDLPIHQTVYENYVEDKLETDVAIPDYYPSMMKILRCEADAVILNRVLENDKITFEGVCNWRIIYFSEDDCRVHSYTTKTKFVETFNLKEEIHRPQVKYKLKTSGVICKLQNAQKANLKANLCLAIKVQSIHHLEIVSAVQGDEMETLCVEKDVCPSVIEGEKEFGVTGEVVPDSGERATEIIKNDATAVVRDVKVINDKVILKGQCNVCILYTNNDGALRTINSELPFSQIIDVPGILENSMCTVQPNVTEMDTSIMDDENGAINVEITLSCNATSHQMTNISVMCDGYSLCKEMSVDTESVILEKPMKPIHFDRQLSFSMDLPFSAEKICNMEAVADIQKISTGENIMCIDGNMVLRGFMLCDGELKSVERSFPFNVTNDFKNKFERLRCEAEVIVGDISYKLDDNDCLRVDVGTGFHIVTFAQEQTNVITNVNLSDPIDAKEHKTAVVLYYGQKGEKLWDVAKKYKTTVSAIQKRNDIEGEILQQPQMLLITR